MGDQTNLDGFEEIKPVQSGNSHVWLKPGEVLSGFLKNVTVDQKYNNKRYFLDTKDGEINFFGTSVLNTRMQEVLVGEIVAIQYLGETKSKTGRMFKDFKVFKQKKPSEEVVK